MMRNSNDKAKEENKATAAETSLTSSDNKNKSILPNYLIPRAHDISELKFFDKEEEDKLGKRTYHQTNKAYKNGNLIHFKWNYDPKKEDYSKQELEDIAGVTQLENVSAFMAQYYVPDLTPPSTRAYYENGRWAGIGSKDLPGFIPIKEQPLKESDLNISIIDNSLQSQKIYLERLKKILVELLPLLAREPKPAQTVYDVAKNCKSFIKNNVNYYFRPWTPAAVKIQPEVKNFLQNPEVSTDKLHALLDRLKERQNHIASSAPDSKESKDENKLLSDAILVVSQLHTQSQITSINNVDIKQIDQMDRIIRKRGIDLEGCAFFVYPDDTDPNIIKKLPGRSRAAYVLIGKTVFYIDKFNKAGQGQALETEAEVKNLIEGLKLDHPGLRPRIEDGRPAFEFLKPEQIEIIKKITPKINHDSIQQSDENDTLTEIISGQAFSITIKELIKYHRISGFVRGLWANYEGQNFDPHANNLSGNGMSIDYDKWNWRTSYRYNHRNLYETIFGNKVPGEFKRTVNDKRNFPNIKDALPFFGWFPTKNNMPGSVSTINSLQMFSEYVKEYTKNFFSKQDNEVCKKLALSVISEFEGFRLDLKKILTSDQTIGELLKIGLHMQLPLKKDSKIPDEKDKTIIQDLYSKDVRDKAEIKDILFKRPEFKTFLSNNGEYVFESIVSEIKDFQNKLKAKADCDFVTLDWQPNLENLAKIPGDSRFVYILHDDELYYVDKIKKRITNVEFDKRRISDLKLRLEDSQINCLNMKQFNTITELTGHKHSKLFYFPLINSFDYKKMEDTYKEIYKKVGATPLESHAMIKLDQLKESQLREFCGTPTSTTFKNAR